jgi:hypothetical protein
MADALRVYMCLEKLETLLDDNDVFDTSKKQEIQLKARLDWTPTPHALRCGNAFCGPYEAEETDQQVASRGPLLETVYTHVHRGVSVLERQESPKRLETKRLRALSSSDVVFCWIEKELTPTQGMELGVAHSLAKRVLLGVPDYNRLEKHPLVAALASRVVIAANFKTAYMAVMEDERYRTSDAVRIFKSKYDGHCKGCGGAYKIGDQIAWSRPMGAYHHDCHQRLTGDVNGLAVNDELILTLRTRLNELEEELANYKS